MVLKMFELLRFDCININTMTEQRWDGDGPDHRHQQSSANLLKESLFPMAYVSVSISAVDDIIINASMSLCFTSGETVGHFVSLIITIQMVINR